MTAERKSYIDRIFNSGLDNDDKVLYLSQINEATDEEVAAALAQESELLETHTEKVGKGARVAHTHVWLKHVIPWRCVGCGALMR